MAQDILEFQAQDFMRKGLANKLSQAQFSHGLNNPDQYLSANAPRIGSGIPNPFNGLAQPPVAPVAIPSSNDANIEYLRSKEGKNNTYDTMNMNGSSAQGPYQITKGTGEWMKGKLGLKGDWNTPQNQEAIMVGLTNRYGKLLDDLNVTRTPQTMYGPHQLGERRFRSMIEGSLTKKDYRVMNDNLPKKLQTDNDKLVEERWKATYYNPK